MSRSQNKIEEEVWKRNKKKEIKKKLKKEEKDNK